MDLTKKGGEILGGDGRIQPLDKQR